MALGDFLVEQADGSFKAEPLITGGPGGGGGSDPVLAEDVLYDNASSGLDAENVQAAIDELASEGGGGGAGNAISQGNSNVTVTDAGTGVVTVTIDGTESARFASGGNVGIGTTTPTAALDVVRSGNSSFFTLMRNTGSGGAALSGFKAICNTTEALFGAADGNSVFGTSSNHQARFYANLILGLILTPSGGVHFPGIGTTANAANAYMNSADSNFLLRSTSSLRYKKDVRDVTQDEAEMLLLLKPKAYKSASPHDDPKQEFLGFTAEELATIDPRLVHWHKGKPDGVQYERLTVHLLKLVQKLYETRI